jgi:hypothetical protein
MSWFFWDSSGDGGSDDAVRDERARQWQDINRTNVDEELLEEAFQRGDHEYIINEKHRVNFTTMKLISRWVRLDKILSPPTFAHIVSVTYFSRILVLRVTGIEQNRILFVSKTREIVEC